MRRNSTQALVALALLSLPALSQARVVALTACGTVVTGRALLEADLDCSTYPGHALVLDGRLDLNGFTLTGNATDPAGYSAVDCTGKCRVKIVGPGTIVGGGTGVAGATVTVTKEVTIRDTAEWGITGTRVLLRTVYLKDNGAGLPVGPAGGGGVTGGNVSASWSTIEGGGTFGVNATVRARLRKAKVMSNGLVDVRSYERPVLSDTTCLVSRRADLSESWGVCLGE